MDQLIERCAGLDVHNRTVAACVRVSGSGVRRHGEVRTFSTTTSGLLALADWLASHGVTVVGMESTSSYWKPVYYLLEEQFECWLLNARQIKNVPGRKTDVKDAEWIAQLVEHGLVRPSFVPPPPIRELRDLTRYRKSVIFERTREVQRLEKLLEDAGIKLSSVASDILGVSGRAMLEELIAGNTGPDALADLAKRRLRNKIPQLREALNGRFRPHHGLLAREMPTRIDQCDATVARLSAEIEVRVAPFRESVELLTTIPGVNIRTAETIIAETGGDMSRFPTAAHLASWAGMCPGSNESAGKHRGGATRRGSKWLRGALTESAHAAARTKDTYLAAQFWRLAGRRGTKRAAVAVGHSILVAAYHVLDRHQPYQDLGGNWFLERYTNQAHTRRLIHQLERLGHKVTLEQADPAA